MNVTRALSTLVLGGAVALASTIDGAFSSLAGQLQYRRDNLYGGTLDREQKKELKAILKSIEILEEPGTEVGDWLKTTGKLAKTLVKAFPGEFAPAGGTSPLPGYFNSILNYLVSAVNSEISSIQERTYSVPEGTALWDRLNGILADASDAMEEYYEASDFVAAIRALDRAHKLLGKADRALDKFEESEGPR